eukprot:6659525-Alexandrium_andersonii.AAC.1
MISRHPQAEAPASCSAVHGSSKSERFPEQPPLVVLRAAAHVWPNSNYGKQQQGRSTSADTLDGAQGHA